MKVTLLVPVLLFVVAGLALLSGCPSGEGFDWTLETSLGAGGCQGDTCTIEFTVGSANDSGTEGPGAPDSRATCCTTVQVLDAIEFWQSDWRDQTGEPVLVVSQTPELELCGGQTQYGNLGFVPDVTIEGATVIALLGAQDGDQEEGDEADNGCNTQAASQTRVCFGLQGVVGGAPELITEANWPDCAETP